MKRTANKNGVHSMKKKSVISLIKYYTEKMMLVFAVKLMK